MSGSHSLRPFLHASVILVIIAHWVLFSTEGLGHHSLSHYHRGSDMVIVYSLCLTGNVDVLFYVRNVIVLFYLRQVANSFLFNFVYFELNYFICFGLTNAYERVGLCYMNQYKYNNGIS